MSSVKRILSEYDERSRHYLALAKRIRAKLTTICNNEGVHVHAVSHRVKTRESLLAKLNRPDVSYGALGDLTDVAGVRVITYYASDVARVAEIVQRELVIDEERSIDKGAMLDPDRFGYLSLHYVVSLRERRSRSGRKSSSAGLKAEIQIRSILQHAWAEIEHDLGYKSKHAIPRKARRTFSRLSGLLELADQEFDGVLQSLRDYAGAIASAPATEVAIDGISLTHFIKTSQALEELEERIRKQVDLPLIFEDWFAESLVDKLRFVGISDVLRLESELKRLSWMTEVTAIDHIGSSNYTQIHKGVGIYYLCSAFLADAADVNRIEEYLETFSVGEPKRRQRIAQTILGKYLSSTEADNSDVRNPGGVQAAPSEVGE